MCRTSARPVDLEQAVREWLDNYNAIAEQVQFERTSADWNYFTNLTRENNQRKVCNRIDECLAVHAICVSSPFCHRFSFLRLQPEVILLLRQL